MRFTCNLREYHLPRRPHRRSTRAERPEIRHAIAILFALALAGCAAALSCWAR